MSPLQAALRAHGQGRPDEALALLRAMGAEAENSSLALQLWAVLLPPARRGESLALLERAVRIAPDDAQAHFNLAVSLQETQGLERAVLHYQQAVALDPHHVGALNNLSDLLRRRGRPREGWALMQRYLAAGGDPRGLEIRLAKLALDTGRLDEAEGWFQAAEAHVPGDAGVAWEHAMLSLLTEDWERGWRGYDARTAHFGLAHLGAFPHAAPAWRGEPLAGKRLLLHREQGLGDMIMFASALPALLAEGGEVHLALHPPLARLFEASFPGAKVWSSVTLVGAARQPPQPYLPAVGPIDFQAPMGALGALRMAQGPPPPRPYIRAATADIAAWAARLDRLAPRPAGGRRIGLVVGARRPRFSDDGMTNGLRKSIPPALLSILAEAPGVQWVALHDRESAAMLADAPDLRFADASPWLTDLADTAGAIENLDLVVTVDTAVAHLAGAMGKPVWLLLWRGADWRWGVDRTDSVFYPGVRIFRQAVAGDWAPVLAQVVQALEAGQ